TAAPVQIDEDALVPFDGGGDVAQAVGDELRLAEGDAGLFGAVGSDGLEAAKKRGSLFVVFALDGVVDELVQRLGVLAVLEDAVPRAARRGLVRELGRG